MAKVTKRAGSPKWQAEIWCFVGGRRKRVWKSTGIIDDGTAKSRQTAEAVAREIERSFAIAGPAALRPRRTLEQALVALTEQAEVAQRTQHTLDNILYRGLTLRAYFGREKVLADITRDDLVRYVRWSRVGSTVEPKRKPHRMYTVHRELTVLKAAFEAVGETPPKWPDLGDYKDHEAQRVLQLDEQRMFLLAVPPERRLNVMAYLRCGLRLSEPWKVVEVNWDPNEPEISVQGTKRAKDKKGPRRVPVPPDCYELMLEYRLRRGPLGQNLVESVGEDNPVFPPWHRQCVDFVIRRASKRALGEAISVNDLRGTWITMMALAGEQPISLAKMAGNSIKMLEDVYAQVEKMKGGLHNAASKLPRLTAAKKHVSEKATNE